MIFCPRHAVVVTFMVNGDLRFFSMFKRHDEITEWAKFFEQFETVQLYYGLRLQRFYLTDNTN